MLVCEKCGFAVWIGVLELRTICVTPEDIERRLSLWLKYRVLEFLRQGRLVFVKKFDIRTGTEHMCLEARSIRDQEALEVLRSVEMFLFPGWSRLTS